MRAAFLTLCLFTLLSCGDSGFEEKTYEQQKETLAGREQKNPLRFLKIEGEHKKNLVGQTVIKARVTNTATVATFRNVRVRMLYYDKEGSLFENHEEVLEEEIKPGQTVKFRSKYRTQRRTDSVSLSIMSAVPVE